ncbi:TolC family protein [Pelistega sp. NLN82]|uniref:TolC family protein n=1 Tax=Pelistega ratti TaxID=2652177 RepID=A0A6L9Y4W4_9BURK|nr:TolC family protein [Pelistega ratti]NEN75429.1 TolC family protein [Pelistega ratti]
MKRRLQEITLIALSVSLVACQSNKVDLNSTVEIPTQFEQTQYAKGQAEIMQWWRNWRDPQLNRLIEQGLQNNLDIALARSRLQEAQANSRYTEADLGVNVGGQGRIGGINSHMDNLIGSGHTHNTGNMQMAGIIASWEPDFFGQKRSDADAAQALVLSTQSQIYAAQMLVAGQIAESYFNIQSIRQQQHLLKQTENTLSRLKNYVQGRFSAGQANANDVLQVESRLTAVQAQQATLNSQIANNERAIAILIGQTPQNFHLAKSAVVFSDILPNPPAGVMPSDVLNRRPDLNSYRHLIQAQAAKLASAKADLYPRFDIQFLGQSGRIDLNTDIPDLKGWSGLLSAGISFPIFTNGRIQANIDAADSRLKQALLQYDKALLQALAEVDNRYQDQYAINRQVQLLQNAANQAQKQAVQAEKLFKYDAKTLDNALNDRLTALNYRQQLLQAHLQQAKNLIHLYKALGGGWSE